MKKLRSLIAMTLVCASILSVSAFALNAPKFEFDPQPASSSSSPITDWTYTFDLNTSTGRCDYEGSVMGTTNVTKSVVSANIQRYVGGYWTDVPGSYATSSRNSNYATFGKSYYVEKGYLYRMQVLYTCYVGSTPYTKTIDTDGTYYN